MAALDIESPPRGTAVKTVYDERFFQHVDRQGLDSARVIVPLVRELAPVDSVVDVGCGHGAWLRVFQENGASRILGYDGDYVDPSKLLIPHECFLEIDLSRPFDIGGPFDLAVCLEVAEHLPANMSQPLVDMLCKAAPLVLFSAAIPGQSGTCHVNEQWPKYWETRFAKQKFVRLDFIRQQVWRNPDVAWWYKQNTFLFVSEGMIGANPALESEYDIGQQYPFHLMHADVAEQYSSLRGLLKAVPSAAWRALRRYL